MNSSVTATAPRPRTMEESVADLARGVHKASSKAEAFNALRRVVDVLATDYDTLSDDMSTDLARLWAFFLPRSTPHARSPFDWCAKAIAKNDVRYYLNYVYVTEAEIIGTDGHSLHIAPNVEHREPGYYGKEGVRLRGPEYARYPDTNRVQPDTCCGKRWWYDIALADLELATVADRKDDVLNYYKLPTWKGYEYVERVHIDAKLLSRLFSMDSDEVVSVNVGSISDSVLVKLSGERKAVVMPLKQ